eukprot:m.27309 g.27309  ORF g.27309 m.27309 type:complete len:560 (-) comp7884_c0_seq1:85-1764(-)
MRLTAQHIVQVCILLTSLIVFSVAKKQQQRPNVVYIVIDDLRVELPFYGHKHVHAPNLMKLANESLIFDRAYCNQPVCSPSRNSFMSGRRPSTTRIWNFISDFRAVGPNWTTLPSQFKDSGYLTLGTGKLFHAGHPKNGDGNMSWSNISGIQFVCNDAGNVGPPGTYCEPSPRSCHVPGSANAPNPRWCAIVNVSLNGSLPSNSSIGSFADTDTLNDALLKLDYAVDNKKKTGQPFFLGMGVQKPHLDWRVPAGWLDFYPPLDQTKIAKHPVGQKGRAQVSYHCPYYSNGFKKLWEGWGYKNPWVPIVNKTAQEMRLYYWAATSYMDEIVGTLLNNLEASGFADNTIVAFHSDHGWALGENGEWKKFAITEVGTRVPLLIKVPWMSRTAGKHTRALVELVDVMPTLADLAGLPPATIHPGDAPLDGISLKPLFEMNPPAGIKPYIYSQYPRCPKNLTNDLLLWQQNMCIEVPSSNFNWMGYTLRTENWRYTAWFPWNGSSLAPIIPVNATNGTGHFYNELYNYTTDMEQDLDLLDLTDLTTTYPDIAQQMHSNLVKIIS